MSAFSWLYVQCFLLGCEVTILSLLAIRQKGVRLWQPVLKKNSSLAFMKLQLFAFEGESYFVVLAFCLDDFFNLSFLF